MFPIPNIEATMALARADFEQERNAERRMVWTSAWAAVASSFNAKPADCARYADACLKDFDERFGGNQQRKPGARPPTTI